MSVRVVTFEVTVSVYDWPDDQVAASQWPDRTAEQYAEAALNEASLKRTSSLDGYADLTAGDAHIHEVIEARRQ